MASISFTGLTRRFDGRDSRAVLEAASGAIAPGEFVVVLGRSGSGKSTLLNLLAGLDRPTAGTVWIAGQALSALTDYQLTCLRRQRIGLIFQAYNLIPTLSVAENVALPLALNGVPVDGAVERWLERVDMAGFGDAAVDRLSGGEQQRIAIARALIHAPEVILADEPTGNLDIENAQRVVDLLDELCRREGRTLVMVTHSREVVGRADRLLTIRDGRLTETRP